MLKSCPKRLLEDMPKTGAFLATYLADHQEPVTIGPVYTAEAAVAYSIDQYRWHDGKLYEWDEYCDTWDETNPEDVIKYYKDTANALMFTKIPKDAVELKPILTAEEMEAKLEADKKATQFAIAYGARKPIYEDVWKALEMTRPH